MDETIGQGGGLAALTPRSIGEILTAAFQLYRRHWRILMAIAGLSGRIGKEGTTCGS